VCRSPAGIDTRRLGFAVGIVEIGWALILYFRASPLAVLSAGELKAWRPPLFLVGGVVLLMLVRYGIRSWKAAPLVGLSALPLLIEAYRNSTTGDHFVGLIFFILAVAVCAVSLQTWGRGNPQETLDLFDIVYGSMSIVTGSLLLAVPDRLPPEAFATLRPYHLPVGAAILLGAAGLLMPERLRCIRPWVQTLARGAATVVPAIFAVTFLSSGLREGALFNLTFGLTMIFRPALVQARPEDRPFSNVERLAEMWTWLLILAALAMGVAEELTRPRMVLSVNYTVLVLVAYNVLAFWIFPNLGRMSVRLRCHLYTFSAVTAHLMLGGNLAAHGISVAAVVAPMLATRVLGPIDGAGVLATNLGFMLMSMGLRLWMWGWDGALAWVVLFRLVGITTVGYMVIQNASEQRRLALELHHAQGELQAANEELTTQNEELTEVGKELVRLAERDPLTHLVNRRRFLESVSEQLTADSAGTAHGALLFLDLDHFKEINDRYGHAAGDRLLQRVALVLTSQVRETETVARLGGDEFAVLMPGSDLRAARSLAERILFHLGQLGAAAGPDAFPVHASIGVTLYPECGQTVESLLVQADIAMYEVKRNGRNGYRFFAAQRAETQVPWELEVHRALSEGRLVLHFQPIMHLATGEISRYEALLRLTARDGSLVYPMAFLPHIEPLPLMHQIDRWVVGAGIRRLAQLRERGVYIELELNLSGRAFDDLELQGAIEGHLAATGVSPGQLVFEITETSAISDLTRARAFIQTLRAKGCRFAIDDLGSGYASFTYLKHLPVDFIKIDGSLMKDLDGGTDEALVQGIVTIAKALGIKTIAEWVEDAPTLARIRSYGVDYAQGYYVGMPGPDVAVLHSG